MPKIFVQSENDEQPVEFTGNITELLDNDTFFKDERYRAVVDESVQRRQKIKALESQLKEAQTPEPSKQPEPAAQTPAPEPVKVPTVDELYQQFKERQAAEQAALQQANQALVALLEPNGLTTDDLPLLENAKDPAKLAVELGRRKLAFASSMVNPAPQPDANSIFEKIQKELNLK